MAGGQSAEQLHARTLQRAFELEQQHGYEVHMVWECDWKQKLQRHPELRQLDSKAAANVPGPMDLRRHALFGGRVEPYTLFYKCDPAVEEVIVLDIVSFTMKLTVHTHLHQVSLYPYVMKYRPFPLGHPEILTREQLIQAPDAPSTSQQQQQQLPWTRPEHNPYTGFLLCRVLPPRAAELAGPDGDRDRPPLLPMRTKDDRLVFGLCRTCAERKQQRPCAHAEAQRSWVAAYSHFELNAALQHGYRVTDLFEVSSLVSYVPGKHHQVWHYTQWSQPGPDQEAGANGLFAAYVDQWLKLKAEASGWPPGCDTPEQRAAYVEEFWRREGIRLDPANICYNPGLRQLAVSVSASCSNAHVPIPEAPPQRALGKAGAAA